MRRLWGWFRARKWWVQILIAVPSVLFAIVAMYVATRGLQYATAGGDACVYIPDGANFSCGVRDLEGEWERIRESEAWKILEKKALRDRAFRAEMNEMLQSSGLPTLDQLDDKRWMEQNPMFEESNLLRGAGRDAMVSLRVGNEFKDSRMVAATKVRFTDYLLLPFARFALAKDGEYLKFKKYWIKIDDAYVIVSDDKALMQDAMRKKGKRPQLARPFWMQAEFGTSAALAKWRKKFNGFPAGMAFPFLNAETARFLEVQAGVSGGAFLVDVRLDGALVTSGSPDPSMLGLAPANASSVEMHPAGMAELYEWMKTLTVLPPKPSNFDKFVQKNAMDAMKELDKAGFRDKFLPRVSGPMVMIVGSEVGTGERTYSPMAFVLRAQNANATVSGLHEVLSAVLSKAGQFSIQERSGAQILYFLRKANIEGADDYLRPCMAALGSDVAVLTNNLQFLERIVDAWAGEGPRFVDLPIQRQARQRMKEAGFEVPPATSDVASGMVIAATLREGLQGHVPYVAEKTVEANSPKTKLRAEIEADLRKQGIQKSIREVDALVDTEYERRKEAQIEKSERSLRVLEYVKWISFGVKHQNDRTTIRAMIELR